MVKIYTNISDPNLTRLAKYMFFIEISVYFLTVDEQAVEDLQPRLGENFDQLNVFINDDNSVDYNIRNNMGDESELTYLYHILADTRNPRFEESLDVLRRHNKYVDCYQCGDINSNKAIIRMKPFVKTRMQHLINSEYSKMYKDNEFANMMKNVALQVRYSVWTEDNETIIHNSLQILMRTQDALDDLVERLGITDDKTIALMASRELDGKYNIDAESINSLNLN